MKKRYILFMAALLAGAAVSAQQVVFDDDYAAGLSFVPFGSTANYVSVSSAEAYAGTASFKISLAGSGNYSGGRLELASGINLTTYNVLTFYIKASKSATFNLAGFGNSSGGNNFSVSRANIPVNTTWQKVTIPIPDPAKLTSERGLFQFSEGQDEGAYDVYVDEIKFENIAGVGSPTASIPNEVYEGFIGEAVANSTAVSGVSIPVNGTPVTVTIGRRYMDFTAADPSIVTVSAGGSILTPSAEGSTSVSATLNGSSVPGTITFSVYPATAGPAQPTVTASSVQSLYSNAYTSLPVTTWSVNSARATVRDVALPGNDVKRYFFVGSTGTNYCQVQFPSIDVSSRTHLHIDLYTNTATALSIKLVNASSQQFDYNIVANMGGMPLKQWKSFDIPLSVYTGVGMTNINQILISATAGSTVYVDNVVFTSTVPLPVTISKFSAVKKNNSTLLQWVAANEVNNAGFAVERSADNNAWQQISYVTGGSSSYSAVDNAPLAGNNYYRLKQVDKDGKYTYTNILLVKFGKTSNIFSFYPNPVKDQVVVQLNELSGAKATLNIINGVGAVVKTTPLVSSQANSTFTLPVNGLAKGTYILQLVDGGNVYTQKFIKD
jgi:hypothetical protein